MKTDFHSLTVFSLGQAEAILWADGVVRIRTDQIRTTFQTPAYIATEVCDLIACVTDLNSSTVTLSLISMNIEQQEH